MDPFLGDGEAVPYPMDPLRDDTEEWPDVYPMDPLRGDDEECPEVYPMDPLRGDDEE